MIKYKAKITIKSAQSDVVERGRGLSKVPYEIVSSRSVPQEAVKLIPRPRNHSEADMNRKSKWRRVCTCCTARGREQSVSSDEELTGL